MVSHYADDVVTPEAVHFATGTGAELDAGQIRVMVVDDDPDINRLLQVRLRARGFIVESASTGDRALARLTSNDEPMPDLLFLDVSMPGLSGLDVLRRVRADRLDLAVIMSTAFGSEQVAIEALREGADDYLRKPFESSEFHAVLQRTITRLQLARQNAELRRQLDEKRRQLEAELIRAGEVQAGLLPAAAPSLPGFEIAGRCLPAREVGGDFYDWRIQPGGSLDFTIGDVMGKGMPAALVTATVRTALRAAALQHEPAAAVEAVEQTLADDLERSANFVTLVQARLYPETRRVVLVDAGHGHLFVRRAGGAVETVTPRGLPLGVLPDQRREQVELELEDGDALILYSDGLTEADLSAGLDPWSLSPRLARARSAGEMIDRLTMLAPAGRPLDDDLTLVVLRCGDADSA